MKFETELNQLFNQVSENLFSELKTDEDISLFLSAEDQTYIRFNNSKVRQATQVEQHQVNLTYHRNNRTIQLNCDLSGNSETDTKLFLSLLNRAREESHYLPEDPFFVPIVNNGSNISEYTHPHLNIKNTVDYINQNTSGTDFTGFLAAGPQVQASKNAKGQNHWFSTETFFLDYSLYTVNSNGENKAVKSCYADTEWDSAEFESQLSFNKNQLSLLKKPSHDIKPGSYKVFLAPAAVSEVAGMFNWGALSFAALKKGQCALQKVVEGKIKLSPKFSLTENFDLGLSPRFNSLGEVSPSQLNLIENGEIKNMLVSSRTAKEYGVTSNGADISSWFGEYARCMDIKPGTLDDHHVLKELGTGIYLANLHYLNWSDVSSARITGMTRYACFWVEGGEIVAPIKDLRFDETLTHIFGSGLDNFTNLSHLDLATESYGSRALGGKKIPGAIINDFKFTL